MQRIEFRRWIWAGVLAMFLSTAGAVSPVHAQTAGDEGMMQTTQDQGDDGTDWGWIGLLGLAGLLGLRKRDRHDHVDRVDTTRTRV